MFSLRSFSAIVMVSAVAAQNVTQIMVGGPSTNPFVFTPPNVTAAVGDIVMFTFSGIPGNHSVTQSSFTDPCDPLGNGFDSGNVLELSAPSPFPTWNLTITNTSEPIWFFCKQLIPETHCTAGMVGSINAPTNGSNTFDAFQSAAAMHQGNSGQSVGFLVGQGASASAVPGPLTGVVTGFGQPNPTATAPSVVSSAATSSGAAASSTTSSAATEQRASGIFVVMAAMIGFFFV